MYPWSASSGTWTGGTSIFEALSTSMVVSKAPGGGVRGMLVRCPLFMDEAGSPRITGGGPDGVGSSISMVLNVVVMLVSDRESMSANAHLRLEKR